MAVEEKATVQPENLSGMPNELYEFFNPGVKKPKYDQNWFNAKWEYQPGAGDYTEIIPGERFSNDPEKRRDRSRVVQTGNMVDKQSGQAVPVNMWEGLNQQKLQERQRAEDEARGVDAQGKPLAKDYFSLIDPRTGLMYSQYQYKPQTLDTAGLEGYQAVKKRALGTGPSTWAQMMMEKQKAEEAAARDQATRQSLSGAAQARAQLAMRGGLRGGARERLAQSAMRDSLAARQDVSKQGIGSRFGILTEDESQRMKLLPQFAEQEGKIAEYNLGLGNQAGKYNIEAALKEKQLKDAAEMDKYKEQMRAWASEKEAEATRSQGGGGGGGK